MQTEQDGTAACVPGPGVWGQMRDCRPRSKKAKQSNFLIDNKTESSDTAGFLSSILHPRALLVIWIMWTLVFGSVSNSLPIQKNGADHGMVITVSSPYWNELIRTPRTVCLCWRVSGRNWKRKRGRGKEKRERKGRERDGLTKSVLGHGQFLSKKQKILL